MVPFLRTPFNYDRNAASDESALHCQDESRTHQSFKDEADINTIVRRFGLTGQLPAAVVMPTYADFEDVLDYHTALNAVKHAEAAFMALPAHIRARFQNDPGAYVDFCSNEANRDEARQLGLLKPADPAMAAADLAARPPRPEAPKPEGTPPGTPQT